MSFPVRLTVGRKLALLATAGLVTASAISAVTLGELRSINANSNLRIVLNKANALLIDLDQRASDVAVASRDELLATKDGSRKAARDELSATQKLIDADWTALGQLAPPADVHRALITTQAKYTAYMADVTRQMPVLATIDPATPQAGIALQGEVQRAAPVRSAITDARSLIQRHNDAARVAAHSAMTTTKTVVLLALLLGLTVLLAVSITVTRSITGPLRRMVTALRAVADRDLTATVQVSGHDEIAEMAGTLDTALSAIREAIATIGETSTTLATASEELTAVSTQLGSSAEETSAQAGAVAAAADQMSANVATMSAATEELTTSISEIAQSASTAANVATDAVTTSEQTAEAVRRLDQASTEIGDILKVITSIAEQTNLLALNATIEAARAGDAGKGFAVVAGEVKDLAQETATATDDISRKTAAIQATTQDVARAIHQITDVVNQINEMQTTIAAAVEEQSATASEISRNVGDVAAGSGVVAGNISGVATAAGSTAEGAGVTQQSAGDLSRLAATVHDLVRSFKY
jgi:methyl-accepting chemotaxis protein